jgi:hypothetical protein
MVSPANKYLWLVKLATFALKQITVRDVAATDQVDAGAGRAVR